MATSPPLSVKNSPAVASALHTILILAILLTGALRMRVNAAHMRLDKHPNRPLFYLVSIVAEWLVLLIVLAGVRAHKTPLIVVLGARWVSARDMLRDIGIGLLFWVVALFVLLASVLLLHTRTNNRVFFPQSRAELALWILVSLSAGICEEAIFRGYLQRQFIAWTGSVEAGVCITAAAFGAGHIYQGIKGAVVIAVYGLLLGALAQWRKSIRPGMIAHAWQDATAGLAAFILSRLPS